LVYCHIDNKHQTKLDSKSNEGIMVGYDSHTKGYLIYDKEHRIIKISIDIPGPSDYKNLFTTVDPSTIPLATLAVTKPLIPKSLDQEEPGLLSPSASRQLKLSPHQKKSPIINLAS
jgi:hypothetical protein